MTIDDYAEWAADVAKVAKVAKAPMTERLAYLGLGLTAEAGEVADHIKKLLRDGRLDQPDELGDVIYYWACLCAAAGKKPSEVLAASRSRIERKLAASSG